MVRLSHRGAGTEELDGRVALQELDGRVALRLARQRVLRRADPPHLWAVLDEAVLCRPIGGHAVMRAQIQALRKAAARPNVTIQVVRFRAGGHAAAGGAFTLLRFPARRCPMWSTWSSSPGVSTWHSPVMLTPMWRSWSGCA